MSAPKSDQGPDYERGFIDGMQEQMRRSVDRAVNAMANQECQHCEQHKARAARWRAEAYRLIGHEIELPWVGLTNEEQNFIYQQMKSSVAGEPFWVRFAKAIEAKLKEKNT